MQVNWYSHLLFQLDRRGLYRRKWQKVTCKPWHLLSSAHETIWMN